MSGEMVPLGSIFSSGAAAGGASTAAGSSTLSESGNRGPTVNVAVEAPPSIVVAEDVARALPERSRRAFVMSAMSGPRVRGNR